MTRTANPRILIILHVAAILALCAVAAQMLLMVAAIFGQVHDLCSGLPFVLYLPAGWSPPEVPLAGMHDLAVYAAFPGAPALLTLGLYMAAMDRAAAAGAPPQGLACSGLPTMGPLWCLAAAALWMWALENVRRTGYALTQEAVVAGILFTAGVVCLGVVVSAHHWQSAAAGAPADAATLSG